MNKLTLILVGYIIGIIGAFIIESPFIAILGVVSMVIGLVTLLIDHYNYYS